LSAFPGQEPAAITQTKGGRAKQVLISQRAPARERKAIASAERFGGRRVLEGGGARQ
jgi:hypothetical protein